LLEKQSKKQPQHKNVTKILSSRVNEFSSGQIIRENPNLILDGSNS
jgi:hypothetical protein